MRHHQAKPSFSPLPPAAQSQAARSKQAKPRGIPKPFQPDWTQADPAHHPDLQFRIAYQQALRGELPAQALVAAEHSQADETYGELEPPEAEVQAKGNWQQQADMGAIFGNPSQLSTSLMARYEALMPNVSLRHVQLHQGARVDAGLRGAGLHGLTDGTNVAVSSKAPADTLPHELGHVAQRQEAGFSLSEGSRAGYEKDADNLAARLMANRPVERFESTVQGKCNQCEENDVAQPMAKDVDSLVQDQSRSGNAYPLMANGGLDTIKGFLSETGRIVQEFGKRVVKQAQDRLAWQICLTLHGITLSARSTEAIRSCATGMGVGCAKDLTALALALLEFRTCLIEHGVSPDDELVKRIEQNATSILNYVKLSEGDQTA
jgi:hypothetical protein